LSPFRSAVACATKGRSLEELNGALSAKAKGFAKECARSHTDPSSRRRAVRRDIEAEAADLMAHISCKRTISCGCFSAGWRIISSRSPPSFAAAQLMSDQIWTLRGHCDRSGAAPGYASETKRSFAAANFAGQGSVVGSPSRYQVTAELGIVMHLSGVSQAPIPRVRLQPTGSEPPAHISGRLVPGRRSLSSRSLDIAGSVSLAGRSMPPTFFLRWVATTLTPGRLSVRTPLRYVAAARDVAALIVAIAMPG
jgi:hypothetical protein